MEGFFLFKKNEILSKKKKKKKKKGFWAWMVLPRQCRDPEHLCQSLPESGVSQSLGSGPSLLPCQRPLSWELRRSLAPGPGPLLRRPCNRSGDGSGPHKQGPELKQLDTLNIVQHLLWGLWMLADRYLPRIGCVTTWKVFKLSQPVNPLLPNTLVLKEFGSQPSCSQKKCLNCLTKLWVLILCPATLSCGYLYISRATDKDSVFEKSASQTVFQNKLSLRTKVPLYYLYHKKQVIWLNCFM